LQRVVPAAIPTETNTAGRAVDAYGVAGFLPLERHDDNGKRQEDQYDDVANKPVRIHVNFLYRVNTLGYRQIAISSA
jgi:hypothetical protein